MHRTNPNPEGMMTTYDAKTEAAMHSGNITDENIRETGQLISSEKVTGTTVYNSAGDNLGSIHDLMIDKRGGRVAYAVMSFGGFLGIGEKYHPLPWHVLTYDENKGGYNIDLTADQLRGAPAYSYDELSGFGGRTADEKVDTYYGGLGYPPLI
jgi:sporulation protein YlmC with PRC-barrel domain